MKQKIKVVDKVSGKTIEKETEIRNLDHFEVQRKTRAHIFKPKKGKGSFKRRAKHQKKED
jgi:stalled ribosome alternative rescue factor ArfA